MTAHSDESPGPSGELALQTIAMPKDTNANGDIFGGWLLSQMDLAGGVAASKVAAGRVATVAIDRMSFMVPVKVGAVVSCYTQVVAVGRSSIQVQVEVWSRLTGFAGAAPIVEKVTEGTFVFVAIDENGRTRAVPRS
ncbi:MAG: putative acyl-CoA thioester hydrolase [Pseudomonadales bacterium]|nr:putative acyl-CoA thioester hydrolase [Pseudomonadales bacterium]